MHDPVGRRRRCYYPRRGRRTSRCRYRRSPGGLCAKRDGRDSDGVAHGPIVVARAGGRHRHYYKKTNTERLITDS